MNSIYKKIDGLLFKELEDTIIVVAMTDGITDLNSSMYTINRTCKEVLELIDGNKSVNDIIILMSFIYDAPISSIKNDIEELISDLKFKGIIVEV